MSLVTPPNSNGWNIPLKRDEPKNLFILTFDIKIFFRKSQAIYTLSSYRIFDDNGQILEQDSHGLVHGQVQRKGKSFIINHRGNLRERETKAMKVVLYISVCPSADGTSEVEGI